MNEQPNLDGVRVLAALGTLRDVLATEFPDTFGGLYMSDNVVPEATITVVGDKTARAAIEAFAVAHLRRITPNAHDLLRLRYAEASFPLTRLLAVQGRVVNDFADWAARGLPITGVGMADQANALHVMIPIDADPAAYEAPFNEEYEGAPFHFYPGEARRL